MAAGLVGEAKAVGVADSVGGEADGRIEGCAADEAHVAHFVEFLFEAEGTGGGDVAGVVFGGDPHL